MITDARSVGERKGSTERTSKGGSLSKRRKERHSSMTNRKLPPASDWKERNIDDWNTLTFTEYLKDKHVEVFGIPYVPMRGWRFEQGQIGRAVGTKSKRGEYSKAVVKRFIDEGFRTYTPTSQYPGTNFGFLYSYRRNILQKIAAEEQADKRKAERQQAQEDVDYTELSDWL